MAGGQRFCCLCDWSDVWDDQFLVTSFCQF
nr:MAG TPA: hypothetical protein [Caudoviricetes sp.]